MSELTPYEAAHTPAAFLPPRDEYAQITDLATRLAGTAFVPSDLQGDPPAVLAAMLTGRELGLAPMESLRSIHMIEGRPTLSAEATMKLAQEAGNLLIVVETTRESATVKYRNASWPDDEPARTLTFDLEDADLAGLKGRSMWNKYPRAMLRSRAITEAARAGGLLSGAALAYTTEELTDDSDVDGGMVEEAVVVESISPDDTDVDELETRRDLHRRAAVAYRRALELDEDTASTAWAAASAGLGTNPWTDADLDVLEIRVGDLERIVAQLEDEHDDEEGDGGTEPPHGDDEPDGDGDGPGEPPAPQSATESDDEDEDDPTAGVCPECQEIAHDRDCPRVGDGRPTDDDPVDEPEGQCSTCGEPYWPDEKQCSQCSGDPRAEGDSEDLAPLATYYPHLNVAQVGELLRNGTVTIDAGGSKDVELVLPRDGIGGVLAAYELVEELEAQHHDPARKTVRGALESAGWTPQGRKRLADARARATMDTDGTHVPPRDETTHESSEGDEAGTDPSDDARDAQSATESDAPDGIAARRRFLARYTRVIRELEEADPARARRVRTEQTNRKLDQDDQWLAAPIASIGTLVANAERVLAAARHT